MAKNCITQEGVLTKSEGAGNFRVELATGHEIICTLSGKIRQSFIKLIPGDHVLVELSPYDLTRGRISRRLRSTNTDSLSVYHKRPK